MSEENTQQPAAEPQAQATPQKSGKTDSDFISIKEYNHVKNEAEKISSLSAKLAEENNALKKQLEETSSNFRKTKSENQKYRTKEAGGNPDELEKIVEERQADLRNEYSSFKEKSEKTISEMAAELKTLKVTNVAMAKLLPLITEDMHEYAEMIINRDLDFQDGAIVIKDKDGKIRYSQNNPKEKMSLDELVDELRGAKPSMFRPTNVTSGGIPNDGKLRSQGNARQANSSSIDNVDIERFQTDKSYYDSFSRRERYLISLKHKI